MFNLRDGKTIQMAHDSAVKKNDVIFKDDFAMVALNDGEANELIAYGTEGCFGFVKKAGASLKIGDKAYYETASKSITHEQASNKFLGRVAGFIGNNGVEVKINTR